jgi:hypothetical protein
MATSLAVTGNRIVLPLTNETTGIKDSRRNLVNCIAQIVNSTATFFALFLSNLPSRR